MDVAGTWGGGVGIGLEVNRAKEYSWTCLGVLSGHVCPPQSQVSAAAVGTLGGTVGLVPPI